MSVGIWSKLQHASIVVSPQLVWEFALWVAENDLLKFGSSGCKMVLQFSQTFG